MSRIPQHVYALVFISAVGVLLAFMMYLALDFRPSARTAPIVIGVPTLGLIIAQIIRDVLRVKRGDLDVGQTSGQEADRYSQKADAQLESGRSLSEAATGSAVDSHVQVDPKDSNTSMVKAVGWLFVLAALIRVLGMFLTIPVFIGLFMKVYGSESWKAVIGFSVVTMLAVYGLFVGILDVQLYSGAFGDLLLPWL